MLLEVYPYSVGSKRKQMEACMGWDKLIGKQGRLVPEVVKNERLRIKELLITIRKNFRYGT